MRIRTLSLAALAAVLFSLAVTSGAQAQTRTFRVGSGSRIQFVSDAPLERITGVSTSVSGEFTADPSSLGSARGRIQVPVSSIGTGLELRDEHLHGSDWLDAARYPTATFEITRVEGATALVPNEVTRVTLVGNFTIHGHSHEVRASTQVRLIPGGGDGGRDLIRAQARFTIQLSDYSVSISAPVRLKVSNTITVNVSIRATAA